MQKSLTVILPDALLRSRIHSILLHEWDPIGIRQHSQYVDENDNEYDSYISGIIRLLQNGADLIKLTNHLNQLERVSMGLNPNEIRNRHVAHQLMTIYDELA